MDTNHQILRLREISTIIMELCGGFENHRVHLPSFQFTTEILRAQRGDKFVNMLVKYFQTKVSFIEEKYPNRPYLKMSPISFIGHCVDAMMSSSEGFESEDVKKASVALIKFFVPQQSFETIEEIISKIWDLRIEAYHISKNIDSGPSSKNATKQ